MKKELIIKRKVRFGDHEPDRSVLDAQIGYLGLMLSWIWYPKCLELQHRKTLVT